MAPLAPTLPFWCESPTPAQDQKQTLAFNGIAAGGNFQLQFQLNDNSPVLTTAVLAWNSSAAAIAAALNALYAPADITGSGSIASQSVILDMGPESQTNLILQLVPVNVTLVTAAPAPIEITPTVSQAGLLPPTVAVSAGHVNQGFHFQENPAFNELNEWMNEVSVAVRALIGVANKGENLFRNAGMFVAQRGTTATVTAGTPAYSVDGWIVGSTGANLEWVQSDFLKTICLQLVGANGMTDAFVKQRIRSTLCAVLEENASITIQFQVFNATGNAFTPKLTVNVPTAADNYASVVALVNAQNMSPVAADGSGTQYQTVAYTFNLGTGSNFENGMEILVDFGAALDTTGTDIAVTHFDLSTTPWLTIAGPQLLPPAPQIRTHDEEFAINERYFSVLGGDAPIVALGSGYVVNSTNAIVFVPIPTTMLTGNPAPSFDMLNPTNFSIQFGNSTQAVTGTPTIIGGGSRALQLEFTVASGLTAGQGCLLVTTNANAQILLSCEL